MLKKFEDFKFIEDWEDEEEYSIEISLMDEKAMSRRSSPFINLTALSNYIQDQINAE